MASDKQTQFISAPQTPDGTGATECEALVWYINKCRIEDQVIGHVWATNTGRHNDAAVLLDKAMKRANLWLACRRHTAKCHIVHANEIVCGSSKNPEEKN